MKKKYSLLVLGILPFLSYGQQPWDLKTCIEYGLKNNRSTAVYANEKRAADARGKEALSAYLPNVSVTAALDDNLKVQETVIPAGVFGPTDTRMAFTKKFSAKATGQLDQTIFDQSLLTGLKANKYGKQQASLNIVKNEETIIYNISTAYYQIFVYREQLNLLHGNQETYRKQMEITALQVQKGVVLQKELDKITVDYNNSVSTAVVAESDLELAQNQLRFEMGFPFNQPLTVNSTPEQDHLLALNDRGFSAAQLTDFRLLEVDSKLFAIDEKKIRNGIFPKISAYASYGAVGFGDKVGPAFDSMASFSAIGLKVNFPILDFFKRNAQYNQARYKHLNALENLKIEEGKYQMDFENARTKLGKEQTNLSNNKRNIELAKSVLATTDLQYRKGVTDLTEWLNAQNSLKEAQNNYLSSLFNVLLARIDLEKASGTLTTFYTSL